MLPCESCKPVASLADNGHEVKSYQHLCCQARARLDEVAERVDREAAARFTLPSLINPPPTLRDVMIGPDAFAEPHAHGPILSVEASRAGALHCPICSFG